MPVSSWHQANVPLQLHSWNKLINLYDRLLPPYLTYICFPVSKPLITAAPFGSREKNKTKQNMNSCVGFNLAVTTGEQWVLWNLNGCLNQETNWAFVALDFTCPKIISVLELLSLKAPSWLGFTQNITRNDRENMVTNGTRLHRLRWGCVDQNNQLPQTNSASQDCSCNTRITQKLKIKQRPSSSDYVGWGLSNTNF